jgi:glycosyltransferase involved in cell wall biosynthesis
LTLAAAVDLVVSPSSHQQRALIEAGMKTPSVVIPNPFIPRTSAEPKLLRQAPQPVKIVWANRCYPEKRPLEVIEAFRRVSRQTDAPFEVEMLGDGPLLEPMREAAAKLPFIHIRGNIEYEKIIQFYDESSAIFLSSYHFDNQPMVIAESVSRYRGVIYCDDRLTEGLQHGGRLIGHSVAGMAKGLQELIDKPQEFVDMSRGAQSDKALFDTDTFTKKLLDAVASIRKV